MSASAIKINVVDEDSLETTSVSDDNVSAGNIKSKILKETPKKIVKTTKVKKEKISAAKSKKKTVKKISKKAKLEANESDEVKKVDKFEEVLDERMDFRKKISLEDKELINNILQNKSEEEKPAEQNVVKQEIESTEEKPEINTLSEIKTNITQAEDKADKKNNKPNSLENINPKSEKDFRRPSVGLYKKIAIFFLVATLSLAAVIFYLTFKSVTITLIPNQERINGNMIIDIYDKSKDPVDVENSIPGVVTKVMFDYEKEYDATGEDIIGEEVAGVATIINNYSSSQHLVATTRLLTPDNKLFRLKETVNVPAGGQVEVEVYADEPGFDMEIEPTKFIIPGLWAGLQDKIYAESHEKYVYKKKVKKKITKEDLDNSIKDIKQELLKKSKTEISKDYGDYNQTIYSIDESSVVTKLDAIVGEEKDTFLATIKANVILVAFDNRLAAVLAKNKFVSNLSSNQELLDFSEDEIIYNLNSFNYLDKTAAVNATFEGRVSLKSESEVVDRNKLIGLTEAQLNDFLNNELPGIAGYEIKFFPSFSKKTPNLPEKIYINIKK